MRRLSLPLVSVLLLACGTKESRGVLTLPDAADSIQIALATLPAKEDSVYAYVVPVDCDTAGENCLVLRLQFSIWTARPISKLLRVDSGNRFHLRDAYRTYLRELFVKSCEAVRRLGIADLPPTTVLQAQYPLGEGTRLVLYEVRLPTSTLLDPAVPPEELPHRWTAVVTGDDLRADEPGGLFFRHRPRIEVDPPDPR